MIIGERIKQARKNKGYSQEQLGKLLGVSKVSICGYEKGMRTPTMETFIDLINYLDLSPDYILGRDINVVCDDSTNYTKKISKEDLDILKELKKHRELYNKICSNPKAFIDKINKLYKS